MERTNCDDKAYFRITNELLSFVHVVTPSWHRREVLQICGFVKIQLNPREKGGGGGGRRGSILGGGLPPGSPNPDPISDQHMSFSTPVFRPGACFSKVPVTFRARKGVLRLAFKLKVSIILTTRLSGNAAKLTGL